MYVINVKPHFIIAPNTHIHTSRRYSIERLSLSHQKDLKSTIVSVFVFEWRRDEERPRDRQDEWEELKFTAHSRSYVTLQPDLPIRV